MAIIGDTDYSENDRLLAWQVLSERMYPWLVSELGKKGKLLGWPDNIPERISVDILVDIKKPEIAARFDSAKSNNPNPKIALGVWLFGRANFKVKDLFKSRKKGPQLVYQDPSELTDFFDSELIDSQSATKSTGGIELEEIFKKVLPSFSNADRLMFDVLWPYKSCGRNVPSEVKANLAERLRIAPVSINKTWSRFLNRLKDATIELHGNSKNQAQ